MNPYSEENRDALRGEVAFPASRGEFQDKIFCCKASLMGVRVARHAGRNAASTVAAHPSTKAAPTTEGTPRTAAPYSPIKMGGGGMGMPTAEIASASATPITTPSTAPNSPSKAFSAKIRRNTSPRRSPSARKVPYSPVRSCTTMLLLLDTLSSTSTTTIKRNTTPRQTPSTHKNPKTPKQTCTTMLMLLDTLSSTSTTTMISS